LLEARQTGLEIAAEHQVHVHDQAYGFAEEIVVAASKRSGNFIE
jgi:hypothetical protein